MQNELKQLLIDCRRYITDGGVVLCPERTELLDRLNTALAEQCTAADEVVGKSHGSAQCRCVAGLCPKPVTTFGEPHLCERVLGHEGRHNCARCGLGFHTDPGSLVAYADRPTHPHSKVPEPPSSLTGGQQQARVTVTDEMAQQAYIVFADAHPRLSNGYAHDWDTDIPAMRAAIEAVADQLAGGGK